MCAIFGFIASDHADQMTVATTIAQISGKSTIRGRDGFGIVSDGDTMQALRIPGRTSAAFIEFNAKDHVLDAIPYVVLGNARAEPTTEFLATKKESDQQPYALGEWVIVHNGTISNDKQLRTNKHPTKIDSAAIVEQLDALNGDDFDTFRRAIATLKGSFAILAYHTSDLGKIYYACNFRPLYISTNDEGTYIASTSEMLRTTVVDAIPVHLKPYTMGVIDENGIQESHNLLNQDGSEQVPPTKAVVVCSGGLDSVVSAVIAKESIGYDITLLHFAYGSRAERKEKEQIDKIARSLGVRLVDMVIPIYKEGDSPLLDKDSKIAGGEEGAEFAHEWVPARNLVMLSVATAFAESQGAEVIILGNNMEEAGAYPDNEPEFINKLNEVMPYAVGANKSMRIEMPVGNMMKHEIVKVGLSIGAPLDLTWSCYRNGERHCGRCGPCYMRRKAFEICEAFDPIEYEAN